MSNSPLVKHTKLSPNNSGRRTHGIDRITIHCVVGHMSLQGLGDWFAKTSTQASSNYGIDDSGQVGMFVEEGNRSWCSSSKANDQRAVTIETASDKTAPYKVTDAALAGLIDLCTDICRRNGKTKLIWFGDKAKTLAYEPKANEMVMTVHQWFKNKSCPGAYLLGKHEYIAAEVNRRLGSAADGTALTGKAQIPAEKLAAFLLSKNSAPKLNGVDTGQLAQLYISEGEAEGIRGDLAFCQSCLETGYWQFKGDVKPSQNNFSGIGPTGNGAAGASFPDARTGIRAQIQHLKAYASKDALKNPCVDPRYNLVTKGCAPTVEELSGRWAADKGYADKILTIYKEAAAFQGTVAPAPAQPSVPFMVRVTATDLNIRTGPGTNYSKTGKYTGKGSFTITEVQSGKGSDAGWGKLLSGAGWISLDFATRI